LIFKVTHSSHQLKEEQLEKSELSIKNALLLAEYRYPQSRHIPKPPENVRFR